ncbi:phosphoribosyltransferase family protein [Actinomycetospora chlora]|uniref:Phosphoribosyltransferase family protein n=1 Tax=Actinomycetospora chlora TaxID=663608 RepID=A0ABP9B540_9PSEU
MTFDDRDDAGRRLASRLRHLAGRDLVVLAVPRSGVPVAAVVAQALGAPLDVVVTRRLGVPFQPGVAMGAIGEEGARVLDDDVVRAAGASATELAEVEARERALLDASLRRYRAVRAPEPLDGRTALIVDDGAVAGSTAVLACRIARARGAARVEVAMPACAIGALPALREVADAVLVVELLRGFRTIGECYRDYPPVGDDEVVAALARGAPVRATRALDEEPATTVEVDAGRLRVSGHLTVPVDAHGLVVLAQASGSSRFEARHRETARSLRAAGLATLLVDLLTPREEIVRERVFDVPTLAARLGAVLAEIRRRPACRDLRVGLLAEGPAAAAALAAAARRHDVATVVGCDARPDLVTRWLPRVTVPVLLVVGDRDPALETNRAAHEVLGPAGRLRVVMGSGQLEGEPAPHGAATRAAELAAAWFVEHLSVPAATLVTAP